MALAPDRSLVLLGQFEHLTLKTGPSRPNSNSLIAKGSCDIFVANFDPAGRLLWRKQFGGARGQYGGDLAVDRDGNIIIAGSFTGDFSLGGSLLVNSGRTDIFLAKLSPDGKHLWSRRFGGLGDQYRPHVKVDSRGNIVLSGFFYETIDVGGGTITSNDGNSFLARFTAEGRHVFSFGLGERGPSVAAIAFDKYDNIIVTGTYTSPLKFKGGSLLKKVGSHDIYLAKFTPAGRHLWSRRFGETTSAGHDPRWLTIDPAGTIALAGTFSKAIDFGGGMFTTKSAKPRGFIARFNGDGSHLSSKSLDILEPPELHLSIGKEGGFFISGSFAKRVNLGGGAFKLASSVDQVHRRDGSEWPLTSFVGKLNAKGDHLWSTVFGKAGDMITAMLTDDCGHLILAGKNYWMKPMNLFLARLPYQPERVQPP